MKKIIFIISITLLAFNSPAQGTLQFNQVVTYVNNPTYSVNGSSWTASDTIQIYTVPANKVVKISSVLWSEAHAGSSCYTTNIASSDFTINGKMVDVDAINNSWLNSGDKLKFYYNASLSGFGGGGNNTCSTVFRIYASLIEYNIIP
jgi:hypothetical protein